MSCFVHGDAVRHDRASVATTAGARASPAPGRPHTRTCRVDPSVPHHVRRCKAMTTRRLKVWCPLHRCSTGSCHSKPAPAAPEPQSVPVLTATEQLIYASFDEAMAAGKELKWQDVSALLVDMGNGMDKRPTERLLTKVRKAWRAAHPSKPPIDHETLVELISDLWVEQGVTELSNANTREQLRTYDALVESYSMPSQVAVRNACKDARDRDRGDCFRDLTNAEISDRLAVARERLEDLAGKGCWPDHALPPSSM